MTFWIISGAMALATVLLIGWTLLRPRKAGIEAMEQSDIRVYRDQLQSVEKDLARGVVTEGEAERLRTEIKRRILEADRAGGGGAREAPRQVSFAAAAVSGVAVIGGAYFLYDAIGAPGYPDMPIKKRMAEAERARSERPSQAEYDAQVPPSPATEVSPEFAELIAKLRQAVQERPEELEGWVLLARNEARLGNPVAAHRAQQQVIELKGRDATTQDYTTYAAILIQAAGGMISAEADAALNAALSLDPQNPIARYYVGLMHLQTGRPDQTFLFWERLLREGPPDAPWIPIIRARLESVAAMAGMQYQLPPDPALAGSGEPSADDMAAAADMSPEERQDFIQNMVDQLGARMAEQGGPPSDWAKLIRAHGVLGNTEQAAAIWAEAQQRFTDPQALAPIREAAQSAGVADAGPETRGPTQQDMQAASEMSAEDRDAMIRGMVDQLGERLATEGGPPEDWARMISSLAVLGESERAAAIWAEAQQTFAGFPEHLDTVRQAALAAGVAE